VTAGRSSTDQVGRSAEDARRIAFGAERLGLPPLRAPIVSLIVVVLLTVAAAFGINRIKVDDSLSQLFRSDSAEFRQYESLSTRFPSSEFDVLVIVEGPHLLARRSLEHLRDLVTDLHFVKGMNGLISLFSAREAPRGGMLPPPLFPAELPEGAAFDELIKRVKENEIIRGKLVSEDGELALIVVSLDQKIVESEGLREVIGEMRKTVDDTMSGSGLRTQLSGAPVMQLEIRNAVERDRLVYNTIGFVAGCMIAALFFRRLSFMVVAAAPPLVGIIWSLGFLGWMDFRLNMFLNVMTPLIMVMGFSDSMQLTFAARDRLIAGENRFEAMKNAILVVGPACVLTSVAAGLSFVALMISESHLIRTFGAAGAISAAIAFIAVITLQPLLGVLLLRNEKNFSTHTRGADAAIDALRRFCRWIADKMVQHAGFYSLLSLIAVGLLAYIYLDLEPRYRLADQVPDREQAVSASGRLDEELTGANPIHVLLEFPKGASLYAPETLATIAEVHAVVEKQAGVGNVWSIHTLRRWLEEKAGVTDTETLKQYVEVLPSHLTRRFISVDEDAVVITGRIPDLDASRILPVVDRMDRTLDGIRKKHADYTISVTGLSAIAARNSASMIQNLSVALTTEMVFVSALLGAAFGSTFIMVIAILPGVFPIVIAGAVLWWFDEGLQFASIVALTVAFGLGLSATIHYLNRLRLEYVHGENPAEGVRRATALVGPALILTTLVLACGLGVTILSDLPSLRLFGWLSAFTLVAALIGDLLILPATVAWLRKSLRWAQRPPSTRR
jgi:predicted RND superfamily exporter protein